MRQGKSWGKSKRCHWFFPGRVFLIWTVSMKTAARCRPFVLWGRQIQYTNMAWGPCNKLLGPRCFCTDLAARCSYGHDLGPIFYSTADSKTHINIFITTLSFVTCRAQQGPHETSFKFWVALDRTIISHVNTSFFYASHEALHRYSGSSLRSVSDLCYL